jgi:hypothetical protein
MQRYGGAGSLTMKYTAVYMHAIAFYLHAAAAAVTALAALQLGIDIGSGYIHISGHAVYYDA